MNSGIYLITNTVTGKQYVGQSNNIMRRFIRHRHAAKTKHPREAFYLHNAIAKYGVAQFTFEVLLCANDRDYLNLMEQKCIAAYSTLAPEGYNLDSGGGVGRSISDETKKKIASTLKGRVCPTKGMPRSPEAKAKTSATMKGRKQTAEHTQNAANARRGYVHSEEAKVKMRAVDRAYAKTPEHRAKLKAAWAAKRAAKAQNGN